MRTLKLLHRLKCYIHMKKVKEGSYSNYLLGILLMILAHYYMSINIFFRSMQFGNQTEHALWFTTKGIGIGYASFDNIKRITMNSHLIRSLDDILQDVPDYTPDHKYKNYWE